MKPAAPLLPAVLTAIVLMRAGLLPAQQTAGAPAPTTGTAAIGGTVMSIDTTPVPIRRAIVTVTDGGTLLLIAVTSDAGEFAFTSLPAGQFTVSVSKGGYLPAKYGARLPAGVGIPIVLAAGQRATGITIKMQHGSILTGIVAENGQPVPNATVRAFKRVISDRTGEPTLQAAPFASGQVTDDQGRYRIWGLEAGEYAVSATYPLTSTLSQILDGGLDVQAITEADVQRAQGLLSASAGQSGSPPSNQGGLPSAGRVTYAPVFFPSAAAPADAALVPLGQREERDGVNIQLRMVPTAKVEGIVTGPDGAPMANTDLVMLDPGPLPLNVLARSYRNATSGRDGKYSLTGITPGAYLIVATTPGDGLPLWAMTEVAVAGRDIDAPIVMRPALTISGRMVFEGTSPPPRDPAALLPWITNLQEVPAMGGLSPPKVAPDGTFTITLMGGRLRLGSRFALSQGPIGGWILKSLVVNGNHVEDVVFEVTQNIEGAVITLTDQTTEISGLLQDAAGKPVPDYVLLAFSADKRFRLPQSRRTQQARPDATGHFSIRNLPAGDYLIVGLTDLAPGQLSDPAFLEELASQAPIKITLAEGEKKVQNIKVGGG